MTDPDKLTVQHAQYKQPWTVPYAVDFMQANGQTRDGRLLAVHTVLHAIKSLGKIATELEAADHGVEVARSAIAAMSADLMTAALRLANLYKFDLAEALLHRVKEKNGVEL